MYAELSVKLFLVTCSRACAQTPGESRECSRYADPTCAASHESHSQRVVLTLENSLPLSSDCLIWRPIHECVHSYSAWEVQKNAVSCETAGTVVVCQLGCWGKSVVAERLLLPKPIDSFPSVAHSKASARATKKNLWKESSRRVPNIHHDSSAAAAAISVCELIYMSECSVAVHITHPQANQWDTTTTAQISDTNFKAESPIFRQM